MRLTGEEACENSIDVSSIWGFSGSIMSWLSLLSHCITSHHTVIVSPARCSVFTVIVLVLIAPSKFPNLRRQPGSEKQSVPSTVQTMAAMWSPVAVQVS